MNMDDKFLSFLDINPSNKGHTLVIPKAHYETFNDIPTFTITDFVKVVQKVSVAVQKVTKSDGYNVFVNNKKSAGQLVPHVHFHILPRFDDDNVSIELGHVKYDEGEIESMANSIKETV